MDKPDLSTFVLEIRKHLKKARVLLRLQFFFLLLFPISLIGALASLAFKSATVSIICIGALLFSFVADQILEGMYNKQMALINDTCCKWRTYINEENGTAIPPSSH